MKKFINLSFILCIVIFIFSCSTKPKPNVVIDKIDPVKNELISNNISKDDLYKVLENKFGKPQSTGKRADVFMVYTWTSFDEEFGRKVKNEIDKFLNILPQKTDTKLKNENGKAIITDIYEWETPLILVLMDDQFFDSGGKIESIIKIEINQK